MANPPPSPQHESDSQVDEDGADDASAASGEVNTKVCCKCGKDVRGHRRFKDSIGYWCRDCHRADKKSETTALTRCPDCGRMRPLDKLFPWEDRQVCSSCLKENQVKTKRAGLKNMGDESEKNAERRKLYLYGAILGGLVLIVLLQRLW